MSKTNTKLPDLGLENRKEFLFYALLVESFTSTFLGGLLGITDIKNSRTLSNKSSSLSFNQKVDLLIDISALEKDNKRKMQTFMEIRNQFMHNLGASTYTECLSFLDGAGNFILKNYPQDKKKTLEEQYKHASLSLAKDVLAITINLSEKLKQKFQKEALAEANSIAQQATISTLPMIKEILNQSVVGKKQLTEKEVDQLGTRVTKLFNQIWKENYDSLAAESKRSKASGDNKSLRQDLSKVIKTTKGKTGEKKEENES